MRVYIAGPMTGMPDLNYPAFAEAASRVRAYGLVAVNPAEINKGREDGWEACMRRDLVELATCQMILLLDGWRRSKGAKLEAQIAHALRMPWLREFEVNGDHMLVVDTLPLDMAGGRT